MLQTQFRKDKQVAFRNAAGRATMVAAICTAVAICFGFAFPIQAQSPDQALPPEVEQPFERGLAAARQREWDIAVRHFRQAQAASPAHRVHESVVFNLALALDRAGDRDLEAMVWYLTFLEEQRGPSGWRDVSRAQQVKARIRELEIRAEGTMRRLIGAAREIAARLPEVAIPGCGYELFQKAVAYQQIGRAYAAAEDLDAARQALRRARDIASRIARTTPAVIKLDGTVESYWGNAYYCEALSRIARTFGEAGDAAAAKDAAALIPDANYYGCSVVCRPVRNEEIDKIVEAARLKSARHAFTGAPVLWGQRVPASDLWGYPYDWVRLAGLIEKNLAYRAGFLDTLPTANPAETVERLTETTHQMAWALYVIRGLITRH